ncbi:MAG: hypothetical protein MUF33_07175 [Candidatus Nanopelagicales bacterium]|jgi:hypothetical protein|nr:hypothetical protein [Candidatus Nanopelagicales bacterium]MCU0298287.1 hypothetical protein [Candidatus Nanopelagicales bacterium]
MVSSAVLFLNAVASEGAEAAGEPAQTSPYAYGAVALVVLLLALFLVTRMNIDR